MGTRATCGVAGAVCALGEYIYLQGSQNMSELCGMCVVLCVVAVIVRCEVVLFPRVV